MKRNALVLIPAIVAAIATYAHQTPSRTRAHVETLASEQFEGRLAGSNGERLASEYIVSQLRTIAAKPLPGQTDLLLPFEFTAGTRDGGSSVEVRGTSSESRNGVTGGVQWGVVYGKDSARALSFSEN